MIGRRLAVCMEDGCVRELSTQLGNFWQAGLQHLRQTCQLKVTGTNSHIAQEQSPYSLPGVVECCRPRL